jgi:hypothetical protein
MFTRNILWNNRVDDSGIDPIVLVEIAADTDWCFTTRTLESGAGTGPEPESFTYADYEPLITDVSDVEHELPADRYGVALRSDVSVTLQNTDTDLVAAILTTGLTNDSLEQKDIVIKVGFKRKANGVAFLLSQFVTVFEGKIRDYSWDEKELEINVYDPLNTRDKSLPAERTEDDDPDCHPDIQGEWVPVLYGNATHAMGNQYDSALGDQKFAFNGPGYDTISLVTQTAPNVDLKVWDRKLKDWLTVSHVSHNNISGREEYTTTIIGVEFDDATNPNAENGMMHFTHELHIVETTSSVRVNNADRVWDGSTVLAADFDVNTALPTITGETLYLAGVGTGGSLGGSVGEYRLADLPQRIGELQHVYLQIMMDGIITPVLPGTGVGQLIYVWAQVQAGGRTLQAFGGTAPNSATNMDSDECWIPTYDFNNITGADNVDDLEFLFPVLGRKSINDHDLPRWGTGNIESMGGARIIIGGAYRHNANSDFDFNVYEAYLFISTTVSFSEHPRICAKMKGRIYDTTWNSRKTAANGIERGVDIIEGLMRHELGLATADIDTGSFDTAYTELGADFEGVACIYEQVEWAELLEQMCEGLALRSFEEHSGQEAVWAFPVTPGSADIDFGEDDIISQTLKLGRTDLDKAYSDWIVRYGWQPIAERWTGERYVNTTDNNWTDTTAGAAAEALCLDSSTRLGQIKRKVIENRFIDNADHAEALLDRLINTEKRTHRHLKAKFRTTWDNGFGVELCDTVSIDMDLVPTAFKGTSHVWEVTRVGYDLMSAEVEIECVSLEADEG